MTATFPLRMVERHVQTFLNKLSFAFVAVTTFTLLLLFLRTPQTCLPPPSPGGGPATASPDPPATLPAASSSPSTRRTSSSGPPAFCGQVLSYWRFFDSIRHLGLLRNHSKVLCVFAGAGHEVMALFESGVTDVTGVKLIDSPPLVSRADPHNWPFFDGVFDLEFSGHLEEALFKSQFAAEMERTVRVSGTCVVVVEERGDAEVEEIVGLFRKSRFLGAVNVTLIRLKMTRIILRVKVAS